MFSHLDFLTLVDETKQTVLKDVGKELALNAA